MLILLTFLPAITILGTQAQTPSTAWTSLVSMPTARGEFGTAVVNGKIYVIGGVNQNNQPLNTVEEYNPVNNQWTSKMGMPTPRSGFATVVYDNKIYAIGGSVGNGFLGNNEVYDPVTNTWTTKASMQTPRADLTASSVNGQIYLVGGKKYSSEVPFYVETDINEAYDPVHDTWSTKASLPLAVEGYASAITDNKIYVVGGSKLQAGVSTPVNSNQVYDPQTDQWSNAATLAIASSYGAAVTTSGTMASEAIYYIGGYAGSEYSSQTRIYIPQNNSWNAAESMPTARAYLGLAVIGDLIYAIGGFNSDGWLNTNEVYKPLDYGTVPPKVVITSPQNRTYQQPILAFTLNREVNWMGYSIDGKANITLTSEIKLTGLSQGGHNVKIYVNDSQGNIGVSNTAYFSVDTLAPHLIIVEPANQSYGSTDVQLQFVVDDPNATLAYSLDGQASVPIIGNLTLVALSNGGHRLTVYAMDSLGNASESTVFFEVAPFPWLLLIAVLAIVTIVVAGGYIFIKRRKSGSDQSGFSLSI